MQGPSFPICTMRPVNCLTWARLPLGSSWDSRTDTPSPADFPGDTRPRPGGRSVQWSGVLRPDLWWQIGRGRGGNGMVGAPAGAQEGD